MFLHLRDYHGLRQSASEYVVGSGAPLLQQLTALSALHLTFVLNMRQNVRQLLTNSSYTETRCRRRSRMNQPKRCWTRVTVIAIILTMATACDPPPKPLVGLADRGAFGNIGCPPGYEGRVCGDDNHALGQTWCVETAPDHWRWEVSETNNDPLTCMIIVTGACFWFGDLKANCVTY